MATEEEAQFENDLIEQLDDKRLAEFFLPSIKAVLRAGGGADAILKKSETLAAMRLATAALEGKPDTALKAAIEILNRVQGKPVERHLNIYADVAQMDEAQLDREIRSLAERAGAREVIDILAEAKPLLSPKKPKRVSRSTYVEPLKP